MQFRDALQTDWGVLLRADDFCCSDHRVVLLMQRYFIRGIAAGSVKGDKGMKR